MEISSFLCGSHIVRCLPDKVKKDKGLQRSFSKKSIDSSACIVGNSHTSDRKDKMQAQNSIDWINVSRFGASCTQDHTVDTPDPLEVSLFKESGIRPLRSENTASTLIP